MRDNLKKALKLIKESLETDNGYHLAAILSVTRGPDSNDEDLKARTTMPIRRAAFGKWGKRFGDNGEVEKSEVVLEPTEVRLGSDSVGLITIYGDEHFIVHVLNAVWALEMSIRIGGKLYRGLPGCRHAAYEVVEEGRDREANYESEVGEV